MPTSITVAPGRIISAVTKCGFPLAATKISPSRATSARFFVCVWQTVTVAWRAISKCKSGLPTILLRPIITARLPSISMPAKSSISIQPAGVQGTSAGLPITSLPTFTGWKPSTSLRGSIRLRISSECALIAAGNGNCTKIPWIFLSALSSSIFASKLSLVVSSGMATTSEIIPSSSQVLCLLRT